MSEPRARSRLINETREENAIRARKERPKMKGEPTTVCNPSFSAGSKSLSFRPADLASFRPVCDSEKSSKKTEGPGLALRRKLNFDRGSDSGLRSVAISKGNSPKNRSSRVRRGFKNARVTGFIRSRSRDAKRNPGDPLLVFESRIWNKDQRLVDRAAGNLSTNRDRACKKLARADRGFFQRDVSLDFRLPEGSRAARVGFRKTRASSARPRKIVRRSVRKTPRASRLRQSRNPHFLARKRRSASLLSARQNGRSLRCRPRPQQGPRGLHRQGRQHQLHDGVAAPRQQVSTGFEPRPRFRVFSRFSRRSRRAIVERATRTRAIVPAKTLEPRRFEWTCARARRPFIALHARLLCRPRTKG